MNRTVTRLFWARHRRLNDVAETRQSLTRAASGGTEAQRELATRLRETLRRHAAHPEAPNEWRTLAAASDPSEVLARWATLPIITKKDLRERFVATKIRDRLNGHGELSSTGGSTGEPTSFFRDQAMLKELRALTYLSWEWMGWRPGLPVLSIWGAQRDIGAFLPWRQALKKRVVEDLQDLFILDGFALTDARANEALDYIDRRGPVALYGYTSLLGVLAEVARKSGRNVRGKVRLAWNGGETLFPEQSDRFKEVFGVPILSLYGGRELGALAVQRDEHGPLHVLRPFMHIEVVDDSGKQVADGEAGRVLLTATFGNGTPFIRYEVGDVAVRRDQWTDGCGILALASVQGRVSSLIEVNGRPISNIYWNHLFKEYPEIRQFQVAVRGKDHLQLRFVGSGFAADREAGLRQILLNFLGPVRLEIEWRERLPLTPSGKLIQVVQEAA